MIRRLLERTFHAVAMFFLDTEEDARRIAERLKEPDE